MIGYIYKITNLFNNKIYIGKHKYDKPELDESYITSGLLINKAINKYGFENFSRELVVICDSIFELNEQEKYYIKFFNSLYPNGYNLTSGGDGISEPPEWMIEINRQKHLGRKQSEETKQKRIDALKRVVHTEEWVRKISQSNKGQKPAPQTLKASSIRHKNTHWYNDGINEFMLHDEDVYDGLTRGRLKNPFPNQVGISKSEELINKIKTTKQNAKYRWYNNGLIEKMFTHDDLIPQDFILGRLKNH